MITRITPKAHVIPVTNVRKGNTPSPRRYVSKDSVVFTSPPRMHFKGISEDEKKTALEALKNNDIATLENLYKRNSAITSTANLIRARDLIDLTDDDGKTILHYASEKGCLKTINTWYRLYNTLVEEIKNYNSQLPENILPNDLKRPIKLWETKDNNARTPAHWAALNNHKEVIIWLLDKQANFNVQDKQGKLPEQLARENGHLEISELIQKSKGWLTSNSIPSEYRVLQSSNLQFPLLSQTLLTAILNKNEDRARALLQQEEIDPNVRDNKRRTALHLAVLNKCENIIPLLFEKGVKLGLMDEDGKRPLDLAKDLAKRHKNDPQRQEILRLLKEAHANSSQPDSSASSDNGSPDNPSALSQEAIQQLQGENARLTEALTNEQNAKRTLQRAKDRSRERHLNEKGQWEGEKATLDRQLRERNASRDGHITDKARLETENSTIRVDLANERQAKNNLQDVKDRSRERHQKAERDWQIEKSQWKGEKDTLSEQLQASNTSRDKHLIAKSRLETEKANLEQKVKEREASRDKHLKEKVDLTSDLNVARNANNLLQTERNDSKERHQKAERDWQIEKDSLTSDKANLTSDLNVARNANNLLQTERDDSKERHQKAERDWQIEKDSLTSDKANLTSALNVERDARQNLQTERDVSHERHQKLEAQLQKEKTDNFTWFQNQMNNLKERLVNRSKSREKHENDKKDLRNEKEDLRVENQGLKERLNRFERDGTPRFTQTSPIKKSKSRSSSSSSGSLSEGSIQRKIAKWATRLVKKKGAKSTHPTSPTRSQSPSTQSTSGKGTLSLSPSRESTSKDKNVARSRSQSGDRARSTSSERMRRVIKPLLEGVENNLAAILRGEVMPKVNETVKTLRNINDKTNRVIEALEAEENTQHEAALEEIRKQKQSTFFNSAALAGTIAASTASIIGSGGATAPTEAAKIAKQVGTLIQSSDALTVLKDKGESVFRQGKNALFPSLNDPNKKMQKLTTKFSKALEELGKDIKRARTPKECKQALFSFQDKISQKAFHHLEVYGTFRQKQETASLAEFLKEYEKILVCLDNSKKTQQDVNQFKDKLGTLVEELRQNPALRKLVDEVLNKQPENLINVHGHLNVPDLYGSNLKDICLTTKHGEVSLMNGILRSICNHSRAASILSKIVIHPADDGYDIYFPGQNNPIRVTHDEVQASNVQSEKPGPRILDQAYRKLMPTNEQGGGHALHALREIFGEQPLVNKYENPVIQVIYDEYTQKHRIRENGKIKEFFDVNNMLPEQKEEMEKWMRDASFGDSIELEGPLVGYGNNTKSYYIFHEPDLLEANADDPKKQFKLYIQRMEEHQKAKQPLPWDIWVATPKEGALRYYSIDMLNSKKGKISMIDANKSRSPISVSLDRFLNEYNVVSIGLESGKRFSF